MCGRLFKRSNHQLNSIRQQDKVEVDVGSRKIIATWDGFARKESLQEIWKPKGGKLCTIQGVDGYTEGNQDFGIPQDGELRGIYLKEYRGTKHVVKIITRESREQERKYHHRWPVITKKKQ